MASVIIFSSPIQFIFALVIKSMGSEENLVGYYYDYQKSFRREYYLISKQLDVNLSINPISELNRNLKIKSLYLTNRFNATEVGLAQQLNFKELKLYEEGMNFYLDHAHYAPQLNDKNVILKFKNYIKKKIGKPPSHLYLRNFNDVYSMFPLEVNNNISLLQTFKHLLNLERISSSTVKKCIVLSQWYVPDGFVELDTYKKFLKNLFLSLSQYDEVYLKLHPREASCDYIDLYEYGYRKINSEFENLPVELFLSKQPMDIYGFWTSTLFYMSKLDTEMRIYTLLPRFQYYLKTEGLNVLFLDSSIQLTKDYKINIF